MCNVAQGSGCSLVTHVLRCPRCTAIIQDDNIPCYTTSSLGFSQLNSVGQAALPVTPESRCTSLAVLSRGSGSDAVGSGILVYLTGASGTNFGYVAV